MNINKYILIPTETTDSNRRQFSMKCHNKTDKTIAGSEPGISRTQILSEHYTWHQTLYFFFLKIKRVTHSGRHGTQHVGFLRKHARMNCEHMNVAAARFHGGHSLTRGLLSPRWWTGKHMYTFVRLRLCQTSSEAFTIRPDVFKKAWTFKKVRELGCSWT